MDISRAQKLIPIIVGDDRRIDAYAGTGTLLRLAIILRRHQRRVNTIRDELLVKVRELQTIQACHTVKEELMQVVWHPKRVGHILETYGWDALDNLLGVE